MTRTQAGVNMVPGAERQGMLNLNRRNNTVRTNQSKTKSGEHIIMDTNGGTTSEQDSAFKKEDNAETPSPSGLEKPDLGFPLSSKRGATEGLDNASKKETTSTDAAAASIGKPSRDFSLAVSEQSQAIGARFEEDEAWRHRT